MLELSSNRKNKVNLADYKCQQDIENRMLLSDFSTLDLEVLEEILYSPLKIPMKKMIRALGCLEEDLSPSLKKLAKAGLLSVQDDMILVDKESRKYFEFEIARFDPSFKPDMEFLQGILRKVPIHLLPTWYSIPRTSNNIFESIVEKYLLTPHIYQRYLSDLHFGDPKIHSLVQHVFSSCDFKASSSDLISKYNLSREDFEEIILLLEFNFVLCLTYEKEDDHWIEYITPFHEWREYLNFLKATDAPPIDPRAPIVRHKEGDFAFVQEMKELLESAQKRPLPIDPNGSPSQKHLIEKLCLVRLAEIRGNRLHPLEQAVEWLEFSPENQALYLYRHPHNRIVSHTLSGHLSNERYVREAEKSIKRSLHGSWVFFDDFVKGILVPLNEESVIALKRTGKQWKYSLPSYNEEEKALIRAVIFEWLFESGMVATGSYQNRECFAVTPFGRFFFAD